MNSGPSTHDQMNLVVAITGASGAIYGKRFVEVCGEAGIHVHLVFSDAGEKVYELEIGEKPVSLISDTVTLYGQKDIGSTIASGSFPMAGLVVIPCSMGTLGAIAHGISLNLIHRCADVCLKERKKVILVPRETPLNPVHLENMLALAKLGVVILPAMPGFYNKPRSIHDLVDFVVARVLNQLGISHSLVKPWAGLE